MQHTLSCPPLGSSDLEENPTFNVVIVYEDFETGKHAKRTYDFLVENLGPGCKFGNQMWKFDVLSIPKLREMAAHDAIAADIILISCRGGDELPAHVKSWIDAWRGEPHCAIALVALFDCSGYEARPIRNYLAEVARQAGIQFFAQPDDWMGSSRSLSEEIALRRNKEVSGRTLSTLAGAVQRDISYPRWGINE